MPGPNLFQVKRTSVAGREANTVTLPTPGEIGVNLTDGRMWVANTTSVFEIGANCNVSTITTQLTVGNSVLNVFANSTIIKLANSTVNTHLAVPTSGQYSATNYFLHANGDWVQITAGGGSPGGANTEIQYNLSGAFGANQNFRFDHTTSKFTVGNSTVNAAINDAILKLSNSTVNTTITIPTAAAYGATNYFLHANGSWVQMVSGGGSVRVYQRFTATGGQTTFTVSGGYTINQIEVFHNGIHLANNEYTQDASTVVLNEAALVGAMIEVAGWIAMGSFSPVAGGSDTQIQYNASGSFSGSDGLTFNSSTNNVLIANTLTVGTATINSTKYSQTANNADFLGGVAAAGYVSTAALDAYQTEADLAANVATLDANTAKFLVGANVVSNTTGLYPLSNTSGDDFGNTIARWVITANSITLSGTATLASQIANSIGFYPTSNTVGQLFGNTIARWEITANSSTLSGGLTSATVNATTSVNSALVTVGTAFVANTTGAYHTGLMNAASFNVGTSTIANSSVVSVTAGSLLSANIQINPQTGTTYTLAATDSGKIVTMNNAGAMTVTLPAGLPIGFRTQVLRLGAGTCTLSNTGQTSCNMLSRTGAFAVTAQYGSASVFQTATANTYIVDGLI